MSFEPDDFPDQPYAAVTSQAGHFAMVGMPFACVFLWSWMLVLPIDTTALVAAPIAVAVGYFLLWECLVQKLVLPADSLMDTASVMAGASIFSVAAKADLTTATVCLFIWLLVMAGEWFRRA